MDCRLGSPRAVGPQMVAEVFVSYHSRDRALTEALSDRLVNKGFSVWFDRELTPGTGYREEITDHLMSADLVLALWTPGAAASPWVIAEARSAHKRGRLVSVNVGDGSAPIEFSSTIVTSISGKNTDSDAMKAERALRRAAGAALGYERISAVGEVLPQRMLDIGLTFGCLWGFFLFVLFAGFRFSAGMDAGVNNDLVTVSGDLYFRLDGNLVHISGAVMATLALLATSLVAPFASLGAGSVDFIGRRFFHLSVSASSRRVALRLFGEGLGSGTPLCFMLWVVATPTRAELLQSGAPGWIQLFFGFPIIAAIFFCIVLLPKYFLLFSIRPLRRACVP